MPIVFCFLPNILYLGNELLYPDGTLVFDTCRRIAFKQFWQHWSSSLSFYCGDYMKGKTPLQAAKGDSLNALPLLPPTYQVPSQHYDPFWKFDLKANKKAKDYGWPPDGLKVILWLISTIKVSSCHDNPFLRDVLHAVKIGIQYRLKTIPLPPPTIIIIYKIFIQDLQFCGRFLPTAPCHMCYIYYVCIIICLSQWHQPGQSG